jgi:hypothetical protein
VEGSGLTGVEGDYVINGRPECDGRTAGGSDLLDVRWPSVPGGSSIQFDMFIVLHGYYSPRYPNGDPKMKGLTSAIALSMGPNAEDSMSAAAIDFRLL